MRRDLRHLSSLCLLLAACEGGGGDDADDTPADTTSDEPFADAPVDPDVQSSIPAGYTAAAPARLIFMGDSITDGVGASRDNLAYTELLQVNAANKWPEFDEVDLEAAWPALPEVFNFAISGATTDSMFDEQLNLLDDAFEFPLAGETIIVFTIGGNDMQRALTPGANAEQVANGTLARFEQIVGWLQNPSRFPDGLYI
jgi:lysophospholipase L1-like esterase